MDVTDRANRAYGEDPAAVLPKIARAAGMDEEAAAEMILMFSFPSRKDQASEAWLGGTVQALMKQVADFFVQQQQLERALAGYSGTVDAGFLQ